MSAEAVGKGLGEDTRASINFVGIKALTIRFVFWFSETSQLSNLSIDTIVAVNAPYMV